MNDDPQYAPTGKWDGDGSDANPEPNRSALSDRDLLFGQLAVVNGFVDQETLNKAQQQSTDLSKSVAEVLVESGAITEDTRRDIEILIEQHITKHDDDPQKSLSGQDKGTGVVLSLAPFLQTFRTHRRWISLPRRRLRKQSAGYAIQSVSDDRRQGIGARSCH